MIQHLLLQSTNKWPRVTSYKELNCRSRLAHERAICLLFLVPFTSRGRVSHLLHLFVSPYIQRYMLVSLVEVWQTLPKLSNWSALVHLVLVTTSFLQNYVETMDQSVTICDMPTSSQNAHVPVWEWAAPGKSMSAYFWQNGYSWERAELPVPIFDPAVGLLAKQIHRFLTCVRERRWHEICHGVDGRYLTPTGSWTVKDVWEQPRLTDFFEFDFNGAWPHPILRWETNFDNIYCFLWPLSDLELWDKIYLMLDAQINEMGLGTFCLALTFPDRSLVATV